jgi:hypothetical protein
LAQNDTFAGLEQALGQAGKGAGTFQKGRLLDAWVISDFARVRFGAPPLSSSPYSRVFAFPLCDESEKVERTMDT